MEKKPAILIGSAKIHRKESYDVDTMVEFSWRKWSSGVEDTR